MSHYRKLYEQHYGVKIPKGYHVHHKDFNHKNDDPLNLEALPPDVHAQRHGFLNNFIMSQSTAAERATIRNAGNTYNLGKTHSKEQNQNHSRFMLGKKYKLGKIGRKNTPIQSVLQSLRQLGGRHKPRTPEQNQRNSARQLGKPQVPSPFVVCPRCQKTGQSRGMRRYHFDRCAAKDRFLES